MQRTLVAIPNDMGEYFERDSLFGDNVRTKFPSACPDIKDAGNCLALGLWTAAVFHLMRVAEFGMRALAKERSVTVGAAPLEWEPWGKVIEATKAQSKLINQWSKGQRKDDALAFYSGALADLNGFKDVYRNHVMHTRGTYDQFQAKSCIHYVREFMRRLAEKIDEDPKTAIAWS
jgi:hypothetical protein